MKKFKDVELKELRGRDVGGGQITEEHVFHELTFRRNTSRLNPPNSHALNKECIGSHDSSCSDHTAMPQEATMTDQEGFTDPEATESEVP